MGRKGEHPPPPPTNGINHPCNLITNGEVDNPEGGGGGGREREKEGCLSHSVPLPPCLPASPARAWQGQAYNKGAGRREMVVGEVVGEGTKTCVCVCGEKVCVCKNKPKINQYQNESEY